MYGIRNYENIGSKIAYGLLLNSGMFWEIYPELSGDWEIDAPVIFNTLTNEEETDDKRDS